MDTLATEAWPNRKEYSGFGAQLWEYCVPFQTDMNKVLTDLKDREFRAGRFNKSELKPASYAEAIRNADAAGTRSIIDIEKIAPVREILAISPASTGDLKQLFGTEMPTRIMVENASRLMSDEFQSFLETYDRASGVYIVIYNNDQPTEIYIAGWSAH